MLLTSVGKILLEVYYVYFEHEVRGNYDNSQLKKLSEKVLFEFLRDYDICPTLVTKSVAYKIFIACLDSSFLVYYQTGLDIIAISGCQMITVKQVGKVFTFMHFLELLVQFAQISYGQSLGQ